MKPIITLIFFLFLSGLSAQVRTHHIFDNNMVLQREKSVRIWGWAAPGEKVKVEFNGQLKTTVASSKREWQVYLDPMPANREALDLTVSGSTTVQKFSNVLVGDVWVLGGQSNMEFDLIRIFHGDMEVASANFPEIRLMTIPRAAGTEAREDFERINEYDSWYGRHDEKGYWFVCSPKRVETFSGLGYVFGRRIHMASQVPIGLIDVSRGGTTLEAWISPKKLNEMPENSPLLQEWTDKAEAYDPEEDLKNKILNWEKRILSRKKQGLEPGPKPTEPSPKADENYNYPGSSYNGMVAVIAGLSVKGAIFHHGYNNALSDARPKLYESNFTSMIEDWRNTFRDDNMPFGIIELSAGGMPQTMDNYESCMMDAASYIREGQFNAYLKLKDVGFASAYDQQVSWYHPQKKVELGERMARWALATQYGLDLSWKPALLKEVETADNKMILTFDKEIRTSDDRPFDGLAMADSINRFFPAVAEYFSMGKDNRGRPVYDRTKLVVSSKFVAKPLAVRYAWARNPLGNLVNSEERIIPVPSFRTDNWDYPEAPYGKKALDMHRKLLRKRKAEAQKHTQSRQFVM